ncbi:tetratricopeptide repeat protein [Vibrio zhugei]|uniref:Tetratricopeptide repeat protein n=1 Tax=Vibrio zhugei TaxID=2479546 RepID=A0ABV7CAP1_9VIBR|nr:hypothetical protein [Vibrio zhugei]
MNNSILTCFTTMTLSMLAASSVNAATMDPLRSIQHRWAQCQYKIKDSDTQEACFEHLIKDNQQATAQAPQRSDLKVWLAINNASLAGAKGGLGALSYVKKAKALLEEVIKTDPTTLNGSAYTTLGSLYYKVPGWPIGFGDDDMAETMLKKALAINPQGIDPNYFYGDFLVDQGKDQQAIAYFKRAQQAPARADRPLADQERQKEISKKLKQLEQ